METCLVFDYPSLFAVLGNQQGIKVYCMSVGLSCVWLGGLQVRDVSLLQCTPPSFDYCKKTVTNWEIFCMPAQVTSSSVSSSLINIDLWLSVSTFNIPESYLGWVLEEMPSAWRQQKDSVARQRVKGERTWAELLFLKGGYPHIRHPAESEFMVGVCWEYWSEQSMYYPKSHHMSTPASGDTRPVVLCAEQRLSVLFLPH